MPNTDIASADYTNMHNIDSTLTSATTFKWAVTAISTDGATGQKEYTWQSSEWTKWFGYYNAIPSVASRIDKKALWTVGQGFKINGNLIKRIIQQKKLGIGKDTLTTLLYNLDRVGQLGGDCFAEIIKDPKGRLLNLKPLSPDAIRIVVNSFGRIVRYEQVDRNSYQQKVIRKFDPEEMFHIPFNRIADEVHGTSDLIRIEDSILMQKEAKLDLKTVFRRYVKPLIITRVDTDDEAQIAAFKTKLDKAIELGENLIIPSDSVKEIDRVSVPQFSTLDPLPWIMYHDKAQTESLGVPAIVMGISGDDDSEATTKMIYLSFEQYIKFRQMVWQENIKNQLGLDIKLNFPASIAPSLLEDNKKDGQLDKKPNTNPTKHE